MTFTKTDYNFWEKAKEMAEQSTFRQFHIGCVAVYRGQIVATGVNSYKTHPVQHELNFKHRDFSFDVPQSVEGLHAEMDCILELARVRPDINWSKVSLYIYRVRRDGELGICRPCAACSALIREKGIRNIYYTVDGGYAYEFWI